MIDSFSFKLDDQAREFCGQILAFMIDRFGISENEALGRINRHWTGQDFSGEANLLYHQDVDQWANDIYYGGDSFWWKNPPDLKPKPYP